MQTALSRSPFVVPFKNWKMKRVCGYLREICLNYSCIVPLLPPFLIYLFLPVRFLYTPSSLDDQSSLLASAPMMCWDAVFKRATACKNSKSCCCWSSHWYLSCCWRFCFQTRRNTTWLVKRLCATLMRQRCGDWPESIASPPKAFQPPPLTPYGTVSYSVQ